MVFPIIYANLLEGIKSTDAKLLEMARLFRVPLGRRLRYIYLPHLRPFVLSACGSALGLSWKAGVTAEIIGIPAGSIGERLYEAKVYLDTAGLFAWTVVIVVVSVAFEKLFIRLIRAMTEGGIEMDITIKNLHKAFGDRRVIVDFSAEVPEGSAVCLMGPPAAAKPPCSIYLWALSGPTAALWRAFRATKARSSRKTGFARTFPPWKTSGSLRGGGRPRRKSGST
jgi:hypothetical protein